MKLLSILFATFLFIGFGGCRKSLDLPKLTGADVCVQQQYGEGTDVFVLKFLAFNYPFDHATQKFPENQADLLSRPIDPAFSNYGSFDVRSTVLPSGKIIVWIGGYNSPPLLQVYSPVLMVGIENQNGDLRWEQIATKSEPGQQIIKEIPAPDLSRWKNTEQGGFVVSMPGLSITGSPSRLPQLLNLLVESWDDVTIQLQEGNKERQITFHYPSGVLEWSKAAMISVSELPDDNTFAIIGKNGDKAGEIAEIVIIRKAR